MSHKANRKIKVDALSRIEGEARLQIVYKEGKISAVKLNVLEAPRLFEAILRGRHFHEAPDITARICGICPVAHQLSAVQAIESAFEIPLPSQIRNLRRLMLYGEWIESHCLHIFMLQAPDFLGYPDALTMAADYPELVRSGLKLKQIGNEIVSLIGGREIHPVTMRPGGFYRQQKPQELTPLAEKLRLAIDASIQTVYWAAQLPFPQLASTHQYVSLKHSDEYPIDRGSLISNSGFDIPSAHFSQVISEEQVDYSPALHSSCSNAGHYLVGPMARYNLSFDYLSTVARQTAIAAGLSPPIHNPFQSVAIRAVELLHACNEALDIIQNHKVITTTIPPIKPRASIGHSCTEAPRGTLHHRYQFDDQGIIIEAQIIPPTSQNQKAIEIDLLHFAEANEHMPEDELLHYLEQVVRNHDPCISCATHIIRTPLL